MESWLSPVCVAGLGTPTRESLAGRRQSSRRCHGCIACSRALRTIDKAADSPRQAEQRQPRHSEWAPTNLQKARFEGPAWTAGRTRLPCPSMRAVAVWHALARVGAGGVAMHTVVDV